MTWKPGEVVRLKSGGPAMTIQHIDGGEYLACSWFDGATVSHAKFAADSVELVDRLTRPAPKVIRG